MERLDVRNHTKKHMEIAKKAASGLYPNKRVARIGSIIGMGLGVILIIVGILGIIQSAVFGLGSLIAGAATCISNGFNLKRIKGKN
ncbi:hypothetical protein [Lachnoclostridium phytofermentans]|uniref:Uncharacterized protein n=1 Tax=Lachnoclostridium phytofermentans (strain ATCC 700394 / DSM 18823 / ISDg) TaxID=357809 RepID=A9KN18_LACP7|nr:hypothetical protein [Lachnoclostridium phytofermentans]ABX43029.1 conserved hypothetical protein [Lachnoclostridium phytofermentans ISDg]